MFEADPMVLRIHAIGTIFSKEVWRRQRGSGYPIQRWYMRSEKYSIQ